MAALVLAVRRLGYRLGTSTVHLLSYLRPLCFRQPSQAASFRVEAEILDRSHGRGLFEPTAAQTNAWIRAGLEAIKIDPKDVDDRALKVFWGLRQSEDDPGVSHAQVTQILKAVCELRKEYGITNE